MHACKPKSPSSHARYRVVDGVRSDVGRMITVFGSPNQRTCDPANDDILGVIVGKLQAPAMQHRTES